MTIRTAFIALSLAFATTPALAAPAADGDGDSYTVRIKDLNLASPADQQRLETRIKSAARSLCRPSARSVAEMTRQAQCMTETVASAQPQIDRAVAAANDGGVRLAGVSVKVAG